MKHRSHDLIPELYCVTEKQKLLVYIGILLSWLKNRNHELISESYCLTEKHKPRVYIEILLYDRKAEAMSWHLNPTVWAK